MSAFKKVKTPERLLWKQRGGVVVFLESEDDYEIIAKRWFFDEGADLLFEPADRHEPDTGGGGCEAVIALVAGARADGKSGLPGDKRCVFRKGPVHTRLARCRGKTAAGKTF